MDAAEPNWKRYNDCIAHWNFVTLEELYKRDMNRQREFHMSIFLPRSLPLLSAVRVMLDL